MKKVRKKLIREKAVIAVYQYLLTQATEEEIENYLKSGKIAVQSSMQSVPVQTAGINLNNSGISLVYLVVI